LEENEVILVTGTGGVDLKRYSQLIADRSGEKMDIYYLEELFGEEHRMARTIVENPFLLGTLFHGSMAYLREEISHSNAEKVMLVLRPSYHVAGHIVPNPFFVWERPELDVSIVIFLVEDYYHSLDDLADERSDNPLVEGIDPLTYLNWRLMDLTLVLALRAKGLDVKIFGTKHSEEAWSRFAEMVAGEDYITAYFGHSITSLRRKSLRENTPIGDLDEVRDIEGTRKELEREFDEILFFEPSTIDERIMALRGEEEILSTRIERELRWPHEHNPQLREYRYPIDLMNDVFEESGFYDTSLLEREDYLRMMLSSIEAQMRLRDFHYVDQSDFVVTYRPTVLGKESSGSLAEMQRASSQGKVVLFAMDEEVATEEERELFHKIRRGAFVSRVTVKAVTSKEQLFRSVGGLLRSMWG